MNTKEYIGNEDDLSNVCLDGWFDINSLISQVVQNTVKEIGRRVDALIDQNDDGMWSGRETADTILDIIKDITKEV